MKNAFTMIELVFVIVVLGILSSIALPRMSATRDDAETVKLATNVKTLISDLQNYYNSQGCLSNNPKFMTNVLVSSSAQGTTFHQTDGRCLGNGGSVQMYLIVGGKGCYVMTYQVDSDAGSYLSLNGVASNPSTKCQSAANMPVLKALEASKFTYTDASGTPREKRGFQIGGINPGKF